MCTFQRTSINCSEEFLKRCFHTVVNQSFSFLCFVEWVLLLVRKFNFINVFQICDKKLSCGNHRCTRLCHVGQCPKCLEASKMYIGIFCEFKSVWKVWNSSATPFFCCCLINCTHFHSNFCSQSFEALQHMFTSFLTSHFEGIQGHYEQCYSDLKKQEVCKTHWNTSLFFYGSSFFQENCSRLWRTILHVWTYCSWTANTLWCLTSTMQYAMLTATRMLSSTNAQLSCQSRMPPLHCAHSQVLLWTPWGTRHCFMQFLMTVAPSAHVTAIQ